MTGPAYIDVFRKINVQPDNIDVIADSVSDTLTLAAGFGISFVVDAESDRITIVNTGKGTNAASEINDTNADATYYPVLTRLPGPSDINLDDVPPSYQMDTVYLDGTTTPMTYNPASGTLTSVKYAGTADLTELKLTSTTIALGNNAGTTNQGANAIAIGASAGVTNQAANSIILNASGSTLDGSNSGLYINPIRPDVPTNNFAFYDTTTKELTYSSFTGEGKTYYVSKNGSDTAIGGNIFSAFATLAKALTVATAGDIIQISAGEYTETFPLTVPTGVSVKGAGIRATAIKPTTATKNKDCFLLNGETTVEDLTIKDMLYDGVGNTGYAFRFAANTTVASRSPYVQRITVLNKGTTVTSNDPYGFVSGDAGRGVYLDGSQVTRASIEAAMLFNECTFIVPNSRALIMTNGARTEWLNCFTYFADLAVEGVVGVAGRGGDGKTYLQLTGVTGTFAASNTISLYATDGVTVVASATIESVSGSRITLDGSISGFITNTTRAIKSIAVNGDAQLSTAQTKFGTASLLLDGVGDFITASSNLDFAYGTGAFTIEMWIYRTTSGATQVLLDQRVASPTNYAPVLFINTSNALQYNDGAASVITGATTVPLNAWSHVAVSRSGTSTRLFLNGVQQGTTYTDTRNYIQTPVTIGMRFDGSTQPFTGYIDEVRISKGVARYTANFTAPVAAFTGDSLSVLLLHMNGANGSTSILDDVIAVQDIRSSAGGTATGIVRYDRAEFAAEMRAISSANVYGNQGVKADGVDVRLHLMAHNFAYIGTGFDLTNNLASVVQANEVIELNNGRVFYNSVDQNGNYRIGDLFEVDFETGAVTFTGANFDVSNLTGITFSDGTNNTIVNPTSVQTGNLVLSGNTLSSITGNIVIDPSGNDSISLNGDTSISGRLTVEGVTSTGATGTGKIVFDTSPTIAGGTHTGITGLSIRDTSAAFDVTIAATSSTALTEGRTLTVDMVNAARTIKLAGNIDIANNLSTTGNFALTLTTTAATTATLPSGTVTLAANNQTMFIGTTSVAINRTTGSLALTGITSIDGYAGGLAGGNNTTLLGAIPYQSNANVTTLLSPNTTTSKQFLQQTGTGTNGTAPAWGSVTATDVGLGNVTNESKATMFTSPTFTGTVSGVTATHVGLGNVTNESKATMFASPTFTGTVTGVSASAVGLGNVTNESKATMFTNPTFTGNVTMPAGTTTVAPLDFQTGVLTTTPVVGSIEFNGNTFFATENTTSGRGAIDIRQGVQLSANGAAFGPAVGNFFGATSAINLEANSTYEIKCFCYFLKTTAGTVTWAPTVSSAAALIRAEYQATPITGFNTTVVTGAGVVDYATIRTATAATFAATGSLTTAVYHTFDFTIKIRTTLACNFRMNVTQSAGTITPQAGSYYLLAKINTTTGTFAA